MFPSDVPVGGNEKTAAYKRSGTLITVGTRPSVKGTSNYLISVIPPHSVHNAARTES